MLLEVRSWASRELYETVLPRLEQAGFISRPELNWSDPETDGEYGAVYLDYTGREPFPVEDFAELAAEIAEVLERGGPGARLCLVGATPGPRSPDSPPR